MKIFWIVKRMRITPADSIRRTGNERDSRSRIKFGDAKSRQLRFVFTRVRAVFQFSVFICLFDLYQFQTIASSLWSLVTTITLLLITFNTRNTPNRTKMESSYRFGSFWNRHFVRDFFGCKVSFIVRFFLCPYQSMSDIICRAWPIVHAFGRRFAHFVKSDLLTTLLLLSVHLFVVHARRLGLPWSLIARKLTLALVFARSKVSFFLLSSSTSSLWYP